MVDASAWTDAALDLIAFEASGWHLTRLVIDGGEWLCTLARHRLLPAEWDDTVDGRDSVLPLAILSAIGEAVARERGRAEDRAGRTGLGRTVLVWTDDVF